MKRSPFVYVPVALLWAAAIANASGPVGIYGVVEKVVVEPNEKSPERIQVWGAFAYVDGGGTPDGLTISPAKRGYLYFKLPAVIPGYTTQAKADLVLKEWNDLKAVAGSGQAIGFGSWGYIGSFSGLKPDTRTSMPPYILEWAPRGGATTDLRVRPASEPPASPATYQTNAGIVKLSDQGSHAAIVKQLKDALTSPPR